MPELLTVPIDMIDPADDNPRKDFSELDGLIESLREEGRNTVPVLVQAAGDRYRLVAGERRLRAAREAGLDQLRVIVEEYGDDADRVAAMVLENAHRQALNPIEEAHSFQRFIDATSSTQKAAAARLGTSTAHMSKALALLKLPESIRQEVADGHVPVELAYGFSRLADHPERLAKAWKVHPSSRQYHLDQQLAEVRKEQEIDRVRADLEAKGVPVIDWPGNDWERQDEAPIGGHWFGGIAEGVDAKAHEAEPCHVVSISPTGVVIPVCTDPKRHPRAKMRVKPLPHQPALADPEDQQSEVNRRADEQAEQEARRQAAEDANTRRLEWMRTLMARPKKGAGLGLLLGQMLIDPAWPDLADITAELLTDTTFDDETELNTFLTGVIDNAPDRAALAIALGLGEWAMRTGMKRAWLNAEDMAQAAAHLTFLESTGFTPAPAELHIAGRDSVTDDDATLPDQQAELDLPAGPETPQSEPAGTTDQPDGPTGQCPHTIVESRPGSTDLVCLQCSTPVLYADRIDELVDRWDGLGAAAVGAHDKKLRSWVQDLKDHLCDLLAGLSPNPKQSLVDIDELLAAYHDELDRNGPVNTSKNGPDDINRFDRFRTDLLLAVDPAEELPERLRQQVVDADAISFNRRAGYPKTQAFPRLRAEDLIDAYTRRVDRLTGHEAEASS